LEAALAAIALTWRAGTRTEPACYVTNAILAARRS
jgi:hypothetical protein